MPCLCHAYACALLFLCGRIAVCMCVATPLPKVGLLVVFAGDSWPPWMRPFLASASASVSYDWLFILPRDFSPPLIETPPNVRLFQLDLLPLCRLLLSLDDQLTAIPVERLNDMQDLLLRDPYVLVEFKPCFGLFSPRTSSGATPTWTC